MAVVPHLDELTWPRTTARLRLRPATVADAGDVWAYRRLPATCEWLGLAPADRAAWDEAFAEPDRLGTTLVVEDDDGVVGDLMLAVRDAWGQREVRDATRSTQAELGWVLRPDRTGRGYATEAVRALLEVCLAYRADGGLGLRRVTAECFAVNTASWRLMERVGMRREQHGVRDSLHRDHGWLDGYAYALLAEEWRAMSERD
jgi:RimJ/RimL family protein N-acetyltransferase